MRNWFWRVLLQSVWCCGCKLMVLPSTGGPAEIMWLESTSGCKRWATRTSGAINHVMLCHLCRLCCASYLRHANSWSPSCKLTDSMVHFVGCGLQVLMLARYCCRESSGGKFGVRKFLRLVRNWFVFLDAQAEFCFYQSDVVASCWWFRVHVVLPRFRE